MPRGLTSLALIAALLGAIMLAPINDAVDDEDDTDETFEMVDNLKNIPVSGGLVGGGRLVGKLKTLGFTVESNELLVTGVAQRHCNGQYESIHQS
jgi:hypothetical protein